MENTWESLISLNSDIEPAFNLLPPCTHYYNHAIHGADLAPMATRDVAPLPATEDREGYYGENHFAYWRSGIEDMRALLAASEKYKVTLNSFLDFGCASGRVIRHFGLERPSIQTMGCDINRLHVEWCNAHLPPSCTVFQNSSIPSLPLPDNSIDMVSAFSVFTHIEGFETSWLMELRRVLRPGGIAWITVHTEKTLQEMTEDWPLWKPVMSHAKAKHLGMDRNFPGDRAVFRWRNERSYSSNVFYRQAYIERTWQRIMEVVEVRRRCPSYQDVVILRKRG